MTLNRNESRKKAMTILYQIELYKKNKIDYTKEEVINNNLEESNNEFVLELVNGVLDKESELIDLSNKYLNNWTINRLGLTDQAILKIAIYELLYTNTPPKVIIDEAIILSKEYSDEQVTGMINGVLDKVYKNNLS